MNFKNRCCCLILISLLSLLIPVFASEIEIQPAMISKSNAQDRVWVGTFQLVWNDFTEKFVHNTVRFKEGTPVFVHELNKKTFNAASLSEKCYYKYSGNITKNTAKNIESAIKKKFNEKSDILDDLNLSQGINKYLIYAMLKKDFEFTKEFSKFGKSSFGQNMTADYFGISKDDNKNLSGGVKVLYYNNKNDFAVKLLTKDNDEVFLYRNSTNKDFKTLYRDMNIKTLTYLGEKTFGKEDELKVPNIKLNVNKTFDELSNKHVAGTDIMIEKAMETIHFNMNNKGVQLKSEAGMTFKECISKPSRHFCFTDTFIIFLKEKGKKEPYFALRVNDINKFQ